MYGKKAKKAYSKPKNNNRKAFKQASAVKGKKAMTTRSGKAKPRHGVKGTRTHQNKGKLRG